MIKRLAVTVVAIAAVYAFLVAAWAAVELARLL